MQRSLLSSRFPKTFEVERKRLRERKEGRKEESEREREREREREGFLDRKQGV